MVTLADAAERVLLGRQGKMTLEAAPAKGRVRRAMSRLCTPIFMEVRCRVDGDL
jgi:hypothetical protein